MELRMKTDISPLCIHHDRPMILAQDGYVCSESGCNQHFNAEHGYRERVDEKTFKPSMNTKRCTACDQHQYLSKRSEIKIDDVWLCPNAECPSKR